MHCIEPFDEHGRSPAAQLYEHARQLMQEEKFNEASLLFLQAALKTPHFKTYELLGECYVRLGRFTEAIPYLAAATTLNRGIRAPTLLAEAWLALGQPSEAAKVADLVLSRAPKNKSALAVREKALTAMAS